MTTPVIFHQLQDETPARVRTALELLQLLTSKTETKVAISSLAIEEFAGQMLEPCENQAQQDACALLSHYFRQDRPSAQWGPLRQQEATLICCPLCQAGAQQHQCHLCRGMGRIALYPVA